MINSVRNTVLSILNKNNYGYISPSDFNLFAKQAQMEIFESYFSSYNKIINMENARGAGTDYADLEQPIAEVLEIFLRNDFILPFPTASGNIINRYYAPSDITTGFGYYMFNKVLCYNGLLSAGTNTSVNSFQLINNTVNFVNLGVSVGDIVVNKNTYLSSTVSAVTATTLDLNDDIFLATPNTYAVYSSVNVSEAEKVSVGKITSLVSSLLTTPSSTFPAYTINNEVVTLYPNSISGYGAVNVTYFRYPKDPKWTYISLTNGEPVFDQTQLDYQDFELPLEDEFKLVVKILQYCGLSIRELEITQYGIAQEQQNNAGQ
jgi:hypothetical protein